MNLSHEAGALVIFDEVITAFRFMYGGAQDLLGVTPDLTALEKLSVEAYQLVLMVVKKRLWRQVAPLGPAYQAGTMAGNPASMAIRYCLSRSITTRRSSTKN